VTEEDESTGSFDASILSTLPLLDFIPRVSPHFHSPHHLTAWTSLIERSLTERVRGMVSVPIRHQKTWTTIHGIAWKLVRQPSRRIIGFCADHDRAYELGMMTRRICSLCNVGPMRGESKTVDWKNRHGGGVVWMGAKQSSLGKDIDDLIVDDPIPESDWNDATARDTVDHAIELYSNRATGSVLIVMSRINPMDPIGVRLLRTTTKWVYVHNRAIEDEGLPTERAFAPDVMDLEEIKRRRKEAKEADPGELLWHAQWQNEPRAALDSKVRQPRRYTEIPTWPGFRYAMGVDLAYKAGERSDYFALVVVKFYQLRGFIVEVVREKPDFHVMLKALQDRWERYGRCPIFSYIAGPEVGAIRYFTDKGVPIQGMHARWSKAYRAQNTIQRWNDGNLLVPERAPWVNGFVARAMMFTGSEKERDDDEFDALVSVCDAILGSSAAFAPYGVGARRMARQDPMRNDKGWDKP
jgi:predicted phage terminase large subunit-like protein